MGVAEAGADGAEGEEGPLQVLVEVEGEPLVPQAVVVGQVEILSSTEQRGVECQQPNSFILVYRYTLDGWIVGSVDAVGD